MDERQHATKAKPLAQQVYDVLRAEILRCTLEPGHDLSELELAKRFGVSKTPVREALATLRIDGLIRTFPRRGYQVTPITFSGMNQLFEVRTLLEAGAAELACARITDGDLQTLTDLVDVGYGERDAGDLSAFIAANRAFHVAIARAAGNARLAKLLDGHLDELERFFYLGAQLRDVSTETAEDHRAIVAALAKRDAEEARRMMIKHNETTRAGLFEALSASAHREHIPI